MKNIVQGGMQFLSEVRLELIRIEWPKFHEFIGATMIVLVVVVLFAIYLGGIDRVITIIAKQIFSRGVLS